jgi:hypothetical protein
MISDEGREGDGAKKVFKANMGVERKPFLWPIAVMAAFPQTD